MLSSARQGTTGSRGLACDSGQCPCVLVDRTAVSEGCDDRPVERGYLGECRAVHLDDEFLKATAEPARERLVRLGDEDVSRAQGVRPVRALEPGVLAQRQVDGDRVGGAALDDFSVRRTTWADPPTRARSTCGSRTFSSVATSGSLACTSSPMSAVALCVSHSSTRRAAGSPTVEKALGARSAGCIALQVRTLNELGNPCGEPPGYRPMVVSQPPGGYRDDLEIVTMSCHTTCGWPASRSGP